MDKCYLYIVLTRTNTTISKIIQFVKNDQYTHAAISLDKELNNMYSFSRKHENNPFIGTFRQEKFNKGLYKYQETLPGLIMEIEVSKQQYDRAKSLLQKFISNSNTYKYNYLGLFYSLFNKSTCSDNRFLCSEFVYYILNECGIADLNISRSLVRPQSLLNLKSQIVFKGNLKRLRFSEDYSDTDEATPIKTLSAIC